MKELETELDILIRWIELNHYYGVHSCANNLLKLIKKHKNLINELDFYVYKLLTNVKNIDKNYKFALERNLNKLILKLNEITNSY